MACRKSLYSPDPCTDELAAPTCLHGEAAVLLVLGWVPRKEGFPCMCTDTSTEA